jgi:hypothetical protein
MTDPNGYGAVHWLVDRYHVGTPTAEIIDDIRARCARANLGPTATAGAIRAAKRRHESNRRLYLYVTTGRP